jgi:hypothetical protein
LKKRNRKTINFIKKELSNYKSSNLKQSIKNGGEIMLHCDEVVLINKDFGDKFLNQLFTGK